MKQILVYSFILFSKTSFSQIESKPIQPDAVEKIILKKEKARFKINIAGITIMDGRQDTSGIGYTPQRSARKYQLKNGFSNDLFAWFTNYLEIPTNSANRPSLLINIKKLWVGDEASPIILGNGQAGLAKNGWYRGTVAKIEYYLQKDSLFIPMYRFDSIVHFDDLNRYADKWIAAYITETLKLSLEKLSIINIDSIQFSKKKILLRDIERVNKQAAEITVYSDKDVKKGIYKTFEDFKMNRVYFPDFEFRKGKLGDIIYVKENGAEYPLRNIWGFCDGENFYINSCDKYSRLIRSGNTFYFQGIKSLTPYTSTASDFAGASVAAAGNNITGSPMPDPPFTSAKYEINLKYYQVDMENGKIY